MRDAMLHPERYPRDFGTPFPTPDHDLDLPICCGVPMCWGGGKDCYCDDCGKEVAK